MPTRSRIVRYWPVLLLLAAAVTGCVGSVSAASTRQRMLNYEASLRAKADWMWDNMNYARVYYRLDAARCVFPDFEHQPVTLSSSPDPYNKQIMDNLNYAALLLQETREQWRAYCQANGGAANPAAFIESRLRPAYESLNQARLLLSSEATATPYK